MKKKILVLSPWYPSHDNLVVGSFVHEQSALMAEDFDVRVLLGKPKSISLLNFILCKIRTKYLHGTLKSEVSEYELFPPKASQATYYHSEQLEVQHNLYLIKECFKTALTYLIEEEHWKPDLIHAHVSNNGGIIGSYLGKLFDIPIVVTEHTSNFLLHKYSTYLGGLMIKTLNEADAVLAVGSRQKQIIHLHEVLRPIMVIGNLVDERKFVIGNHEKAHKFNILIVARPSYEKDLTTFIYAIKELILAGNTDIIVTIVLGTSKENSTIYKDYGQMCKDLEIEQFCHFHYLVPRDKIILYYQNCDIFVSSSIVESFGVSICEAMACGKPVVSTKNGGAEDIIQENNGLLVLVQDFKAMAGAILKVKNKEIIFEPEVVRESVIHRFGKQSFKSRIKVIYEQVINDHKNK